jgi:hypothetical protein
MADVARELRSIADDIEALARRIRRSPTDPSVATWARRIVSLTDDIATIVRKLQ